MSGIGLGSNISSLVARRRLDESSAATSRVYERLSSGLRINRASDDAAGLAISSSLNARSRVYSQGVRNINDGLSTLAIADGTISNLTTVVTRIRELAQQAANGTLSKKQREALDAEAQQLSAEFFRITKATKFNGLGLFDGSISSGLRIQAGYGDNGGVNSTLGGALGTGTFGSGTLYSGQSALTAEVQLKDLNGDGHLDLISLGGNDDASNTVNIRLGDGTGSFGAETSYLVSGGSTSGGLALADLNGDGVLDLVTAGNGGATIRLGNGDGTFGAVATYQSESSGSADVTLGDVNNDGILDLVTAGNAANVATATIRLGNGDGTFGVARSYTTETGAKTSNVVALADFNGDGNLDLVTAREDGAQGILTLRLGNGDGTFGATSTYVTEAAETKDLTFADLNGDGFLDIVTAGSSGSAGYATVLLGNGDGTFGDAVSYAQETSETQEVKLYDLNGDGILDLITSGVQNGGSFPGKLTVRLGNGDGTFGAATSYTTESSTSFGLALGDLNGDGVLDVVTGGSDLANSQGGLTVRLATTQDGINPLLSFSLATQADAKQAIGLLDNKLKSLSNQRGVIGAFQSRLGAALNNLQSTTLNYSAAASRITDTDVAFDAAELVRTQILSQSATAVLAQANQLPALALTLLSR